MNLIVKIPLLEQDVSNTVESARSICRALKDSNLCTSFSIVNRANEGRVDCYFYDYTPSLIDLQREFSKFTIDRNNIQEFAMSPDHSLVKMAGLTVEVLLKECKAEERHIKLVTEHMHYILNGLGNGYKEEIDFYLNAIRIIVNQIMIHRESLR